MFLLLLSASFRLRPAKRNKSEQAGSSKDCRTQLNLKLESKTCVALYPIIIPDRKRITKDSICMLVALPLKALPVHYGWPALVKLVLTDPHALEGAQARQDAPSDPDAVLPLWGSDDLDLH